MKTRLGLGGSIQGTVIYATDCTPFPSGGKTVMDKIVEITELLLQRESKMFDRLMSQIHQSGFWLTLVVFLTMRFSRAMLLLIVWRLGRYFSIW
jgi:phosphoribosyl 1,2-cyclic phosphodiesterase